MPEQPRRHPLPARRHGEAEVLYRRALAIKHTVLGPDHPELAILLNNLAVLATAREDKAQARLLYRRAIALLEPAVTSDHPTLRGCRQALLALMDSGHARGEAPSCLTRARTPS